MSLALAQPTGVRLPSRVILFWGLVFDPAAYPQLAGWVLCDGANGTPDMRTRMARGTPAAGVILQAGGCSDHCHPVVGLATDSLTHCHPTSSVFFEAHDHAGSSMSGCTHDHPLSCTVACAWDHTHGRTTTSDACCGCRVLCEEDSLHLIARITHDHWVGNSGPGQLHDHGLTVAPDVNHSHVPTFTEDNHSHTPTVSDAAHLHTVGPDVTQDEIGLLPPYRNLHMIMKL